MTEFREIFEYLTGKESDNNKFICPECKTKNLILWKDKASCKNCLITFEKDTLKTFYKENINKQFRVIDYGLPDPTFTPGGISRTNQLVECPLCKHQFVQHVVSGCFHTTREPLYCPKCKFNLSLLQLIDKLREVK